MWQDPIVEELRSHREAHAQAHAFNSDSIFAELQLKQNIAKKQGVVFVSLPPKPVQSLKKVA